MHTFELKHISCFEPQPWPSEGFFPRGAVVNFSRVSRKDILQVWKEWQNLILPIGD